MKLKHNKKRNTAFLFETLVRELTRAAIRKDTVAAATCKTILKEHFSSGTILYEELKLYRALYETWGLSKSSAEKLLREIRRSYSKMRATGAKQIFSEQSQVIKKLNKNISKNVFSNFVPQYKNLATVYQIFNGGLAPEKRILLEEIVCNSLSSKKAFPTTISPPPIDNLVIKNFIKKFNDRYSGTLHEEQSKLLNNYVLSFSDNGLALKAFLNEEIGRLRGVITSGLAQEEISRDVEMVQKTKQTLQLLDSFANQKINNQVLEAVLKIQGLVREIEA